MKREDICCFDAEADLSIIDRNLPHWSQSGTLCFVTWRAADSLPSDVLERLDLQIADELRRHDLDPFRDWKSELAKRDSTQRGRVQWDLFATRDRFLDQGYGRCLLAAPACSEIVEKSLLHFDEDRYFLTDAVVMPNHVHFLAAFANQDTFLKQCAEWKRFMAREIHKVVGQRGDYWQVDQFDHLIRTPDQFKHYRRYIAENPIKAHLPSGSYRHYQKQLDSLSPRSQASPQA
jgi:type I restriction enzyme R subunit